MTRNIAIILVLSLVLTACGTVATPEFAAEVQETRIAEAATAAVETSEAPTSTPTEPPTATPTEEPTATPLPPTETPVPPTEAPTDAATEVPADNAQDAEASSAEGPSGDPAAGETIFTTFYPEVNFACNTCHLNNSEAQLIGPGLLNISVRGAERVDGQSAEEYIRNSILHPSDYVVEGFPDMLMPQLYGDFLSDEDMDNIVAYLFTLTG